MLYVHEEKENKPSPAKDVGLDFIYEHPNIILRICHCPIAPIHVVLKSILYIK
jgi:hypothetical protein